MFVAVACRRPHNKNLGCISYPTLSLSPVMFSHSPRNCHPLPSSIFAQNILFEVRRERTDKQSMINDKRSMIDALDATKTSMTLQARRCLGAVIEKGQHSLGKFQEEWQSPRKWRSYISESCPMCRVVRISFEYPGFEN